MSLFVWRKKYYPVRLNNMACCAYLEHQQEGHCLSLPALLSRGVSLSFAPSPGLYIYIQGKVISVHLI